MPFQIIRGTFHIQGYQPDGDSIRFKAQDEADWAKLAGPPVRLNARRHAQLRLEAIDTLETHFMNMHQPLLLANKALENLLRALGIARFEVDAGAGAARVSAADDGTQGYIISRAVEKNQRPIAFAYAGAPPPTDGPDFFLTAEQLQRSANFAQLEAGLAYPTYYKGLFADLREACTAAVRKARAARLGIWSEDHTTSGFPVERLTDITERYVILPKLFRRLAEYLEGGGSVAGFKGFLATRAEDVLVISKGHFTHLDTLVKIKGHTVRMAEPCENLMFFE